MISHRDQGDEVDYYGPAYDEKGPQILQEALPHRIDPPTDEQKRRSYLEHLKRTGRIHEDGAA